MRPVTIYGKVRENSALRWWLKAFAYTAAIIVLFIFGGRYLSSRFEVTTLGDLKGDQKVSGYHSAVWFLGATVMPSLSVGFYTSDSTEHDVTVFFVSKSRGYEIKRLAADTVLIVWDNSQDDTPDGLDYANGITFLYDPPLR